MAKKSKKKSSTFWQWLMIALVAFLLYHGLKNYLPSTKRPSEKPIALKKTKEEVPPSPHPSPKAVNIDGPIKSWNFETAGHFLPKGAYPDNYLSIPVDENGTALLGYAKPIEGKTPGPQGLTNTHPGLSMLKWDGKKYLVEDLDFSKLTPALSGVSIQKMTGLPQITKKPIEAGTSKIFPVKIFLSDDSRVVVSYLLEGAKGLEWSLLKNSAGKETPAAFVQGTTRDITRTVKTEKHQNKTYLIVESGKIDPQKLYEGYHWNVEAYGWDGKVFAYDKEYSEKLTKEKK